MPKPILTAQPKNKKMSGAKLLLVNQDAEEEDNLQNEATREEAQELVLVRQLLYFMSCKGWTLHCRLCQRN
jgi:hypothetical protein